MLMFWGCAAVILILALMPATVYLPGTGWDKSNHVLAYGVLAMLGFRAYPDRIAMVLAGAILHGGLIEVLQSLTPDRSADWQDLAADAVGVLLGRILLAFRWARRC